MTVDATTRPHRRARQAPRSAARRGILALTLVRHGLLMLLAFVGIVLLLELVSPFRGSQLGAMAYFVPAVAGPDRADRAQRADLASATARSWRSAPTRPPSLLERARGRCPSSSSCWSRGGHTLVGAVVGAAAARLHGPYLAGATLALAVGAARPGAELRGACSAASRACGSPAARERRVPDVLLRGQPRARPAEPKYLAYLGWALALVVLLLLSNLCVSRYGRDWRAVRDDEVAAELAGIDLGRARVLAFVVSAACAGLAGAMLAVVPGWRRRGSFTIVLSISLLVGHRHRRSGQPRRGAARQRDAGVPAAGRHRPRACAAGSTPRRRPNIAPLVYGVVLIAGDAARPARPGRPVCGACLARSGERAARPARRASR